MAFTKISLVLLLCLLGLYSETVKSQNCGCAPNLCCSQFGYCGTDDAYCGAGCRSGPCRGSGTPTGGSVGSIVTHGFFNNIINQAGNGCAGKSFYTRDSFVNAANTFPNFANSVTRREIATMFAHFTHETGHFCYIEEIDGASRNYCQSSNTQYPCAPGKGYFGRGPIQLSWNRRLSKLRVLARSFIHCNIVSGRTALFWHDNWTGLGPLIDVVGAAGPLVSGIGLASSVLAAVAQGDWSLPRGRHPAVQLLRVCLHAQTPPLPTEIDDDIYLWKSSADQLPGSFSSAKTWRHIHPPGPTVPWHTQVWFKEKIPKLAFMFWLTVQDRLTTRDRLRRWNLPVPSSCLLCLSSQESRDHLFFQCRFSNTLWLDFFGLFTPLPSSCFPAFLNWIKKPTTNRKLNAICKLVCHAVVYNIWKERNSRLFSSTLRSEYQLKREIQLLLRRRLAGLDRKITPLQSTTTQETYLSLWFGHFQQ